MNNKGQLGLGALIVAAIGVIVALTLLTGSGGISGGVGTLTSTTAIVNESITLPASGAYLDRANCVNYAGTPIMINNSVGSAVINAGNYTFTTRVSPTNGLKVLTIRPFDTVGEATNFSLHSVNVSYTCLPQGYAEDSAARNIISLIIVLAAIAILAFVLFFAYKNMQDII